MNIYKRYLNTGIGLIIFTIGILTGCENQETWLTYTNKSYGYSIEYPCGWSVSEPFQNRQMVVIKSPAEKEIISVLINANKGLTLDQEVNYYVYATREGSYYYKLVSDENVKHQKIEARLLEVVFQSQEDSQRLNVKELYLMDEGKFYLVRFATALADLNSLSPVYQHVFSSFQLIR
jgi:hypothetical protein